MRLIVSKANPVNATKILVFECGCHYRNLRDKLKMCSLQNLHYFQHLKIVYEYATYIFKKNPSLIIYLK